MLIVPEPATTSGPTLLVARDVGRPLYGYSATVLPSACDLTAETLIPRVRSNHARAVPRATRWCDVSWWLSWSLVIRAASSWTGMQSPSTAWMCSYSTEQSCIAAAANYCITLYFRGKKISRKFDLKYFREKIFSRIKIILSTRKYLPAKITSRENICPRKYLPAIFYRAAKM